MSGRELVAAELFVQRALVVGGQALAAVLAREADPGEARVEHLALDLAVVLEVEPLLLLGEVQQRRAVLLVRARACAGWPGSRYAPAAGNPRQTRAACRLMPSPFQPLLRRRPPSAAGAPAGCRTSARLTVTRRRYRWMSCSKVTPMPPCICTQSCSSFGAVIADVGLGGADQIGGVRRAGVDGDGRRVVHRVARLQPRKHVGEAVLDLLIRRERPAERVAVERPGDRHVEARPASRRRLRRCARRRRSAAGARPARPPPRPRPRERRPAAGRRRNGPRRNAA